MRVFIAVNIPDDTKDRIYSFIEILKKKESEGIKYVAKENLHLTLKFLGEIDKDNLELINESLSNIDFNLFNLILKGTGCFPSLLNPRVLWIGIKDDKKNLFNLFRKIESNLPKNLSKGEDRDFSPHLTIARFKLKPAEEFIDFIKSEKDIYFGKLFVTSFCIYESILKSSGPVYIKLNEFFC